MKRQRQNNQLFEAAFLGTFFGIIIGAIVISKLEEPKFDNQELIEFEKEPFLFQKINKKSILRE